MHVPSRRHSANMPRDFVKMEPILEREGILVRARIGAAEVRLVAAVPMRKLVLGMLARDPFLLLAEDAAERERRRYRAWNAAR